MQDVSKTTLTVLTMLAVVTSVIAMVAISETPTTAVVVDIPTGNQVQEDHVQESSEEINFTRPIRSQDQSS